MLVSRDVVPIQSCGCRGAGDPAAGGQHSRGLPGSCRHLAGSRVGLVGVSGVFLLVIVPLLGCRGESGSSPRHRPPSPLASDEVISFATEELSEVGGYLPLLDDGRVQVAPPVDWHVSPRSKAYVVRFVFDRRQRFPLPRITVEARDAAANDPHYLDEENLVTFVDSLLGRMDAKVLMAMEGGVDPLVLGSVACARYVVSKKFRLGGRVISAECEVLKTIRGGRVYTVVLDANADTLVDFRADAYAVMANMKFPQEQGVDAVAAKGEEGGRQLPADKQAAVPESPADDAKEQKVEKTPAADVFQQHGS